MRIIPHDAMIKFIVLCAFLASVNLNANAISANLCTTKVCEKLGEDIGCINRTSVVDCAISLQYGQADFTIADADEALLISSFYPDLQVLAQIRPIERVEQTSEFDIVFVGRNVSSEGIKDIKGKKLCHPGYSMKHIPPLMLKEIEISALKMNGYNVCAGLMDAEKYTHDFFDLFGESCRPGLWSVDLEEDNRLKNLCKYENLTNLCKDDNHGDFETSLKCLLDGDGNLAITTLHEFNTKVPDAEKKEYKFICEDGSAVDHEKPCNWGRQPWPIILGRKEISLNSLNVIKNSLTNESNPLTNLLFSNTNDKIIIESKPLSLKEFMNGFRKAADLVESRKCGEMKFCTINEAEKNKCLWMAQAAANAGIHPAVTCELSTDKLECMKQMEQNNFDVVAIDDDAYVAVRRGLKAISFPETPQHFQKYYLIVKKDADIKTFADLKGKHGCFSSLDDNSMVALGNVLREKNLFPHGQTCGYASLMSDIFAESCLPGGRDNSYRKLEMSDNQMDHMCAICTPTLESTAVTCNADSSNVYYGNNGALKCLKEVGDFAVISTKDVNKKNLDNFKVLCRNEIFENFSNVSEDCALTTVTESVIVARNTYPNLKKMSLAFEEFNNYLSVHSFFNVFNEFNQTKDLIFKDYTTGLSMNTSSTEEIQNYVKLFKQAEACSDEDEETDSSSTNLLPMTALLAFTLFYNLF